MERSEMKKIAIGISKTAHTPEVILQMISV
jgi:hypothetical protein